MGTVHDYAALLPATEEFVRRRMDVPGNISLYYFQPVCDADKIERLLIYPIATAPEPASYVESICRRRELGSSEELYGELIRGNVLVALEAESYLFDASKTWNDKPGEANIETTVQGPQSTLSENAAANAGIIRHRYPAPGFRMESLQLGAVTRTPALLLYDADKADPAVLADVKSRIARVEADVVQSTGQLEKLINKQKRSLFPTMILTDRPDRIVLNLAQGKAILLMEGTPFSLVFPAVFYDFMSAMDDLYLPHWVTRMLVFFRYIALFIAITFPAIYVSVISFNPELFRVQMTLSLAGSRANVPYPSYVEVLFMLFMAEAMTEASIRLPRFMGSTATTVGGLILGQAAQQAGLVSSAMIITTSAVIISSFVIPINTMSFAIRAVRYPLLLISSMLGLFGAVVGLFCIVCYLASLRSFGYPYLKGFVGEPSVSFGRRKGQRGTSN
ncbi:spore germination protein [Cohnella xylanilytica]|uniref:spore germination protein n=1 Tax=Cohnella xylanilytica TaxID=557555 RepID=UPI001B1135B3|nr:spore germination protein [Cohnella xylanilytica]GIO11572.1 spore germination protein [Cohnella xylanilytica]